MIRKIMKDPLFLAQKGTDATPADIPVVMDMLETLSAHKAECVGMAANMIGEKKRIIVFTEEKTGQNRILFNPSIVSKSGEYEAEEGCLSLPGTRKTKRFKTITVEYQDFSFQKKRERFTGFTAEIIQHEIDMTNGILI